jgi:hypothetical protein
MPMTDAVISPVDRDNPGLLVGRIVPPTLQLFDTTSVVVVWWNVDPDIPWIVMV